MLDLILGILWLVSFFISVGFRTWRDCEGKWKIIRLINIFLELVIGVWFIYDGVTALVA